MTYFSIIFVMILATGSDGDAISNPILLMEVRVRRCVNVLVFCERLLASVQSGANTHGLKSVPGNLLLPLIRILQVLFMLYRILFLKL